MWIFYSTQNFQCDQKVPEGVPNERQRLLLLRLLFGMWNIGAYHRGLMAGRTPAIHYR